jgi:hypothetical protein
MLPLILRFRLLCSFIKLSIKLAHLDCDRSSIRADEDEDEDEEDEDEEDEDEDDEDDDDDDDDVLNQHA